MKDFAPGITPEPQPDPEKSSFVRLKGQVLIPSQAVLKQNAILGGLTPAMIAEVLKTAKLIALETSQQIYEADRPIRDVYFPINSVLSVVTQMRDGGSIEVRDGRARGSLGNPAATRSNDLG